uniref:Rpl6_ii n=1 Tax=Oxytricha trifallax TaxID=1172189 RepID=G9HRE1_9SPIT|nr:rpl6_ii [Oxytricha trifallax]
MFYAFSKIFFKKLKFRGKGYYVYKNKRNTVALQFGYSHIKRLFFFIILLNFYLKLLL